MADKPKFPVTMHHPEAGGETHAATRTSLRVLEDRGWKRGPLPSDDQFNPAAYSVDEVNAYLADADDVERRRVMAAEAAGKDRATVRPPTSDSDQS